MSYTLNQRQKEAIEYIDGPLLIVAGAGTGKTTVISQKIAYLIENKLAKPEEILALTFTDKAAQEMQDRVDQLLNIGYVDLQISTFHAFAQKLLEDFGMEVGLSRNFKLLTQTDAWLFIEEHLIDFNFDYYRPLGDPTSHIHELLKHFSKCKDELISSDDYLKFAEGHKLDGDNAELVIADAKRLIEIANSYHKYNQLLLDNNYLDFGDLIFYCVKLLFERKNILEKLQTKFKYILIDEFQDVNYSQYELIRLLANKSQLTVVGDDDQSIYSFRGSNVSIILRFKEDYPKSKEIILTENYRSNQEILDLAYKSIQNNNPDRLEVKLNVDKKLSANGGKNLKSKIKNLKSVEYLSADTLDDEVKKVVEKIFGIKESDKEISWDDFAILVRANSHAEPFLNGLESAGIPYEFLASSGLYRQPIVLDCLSFFKVIDNYHESSAIYRLLCMPFLNFKENDLQKITSFAKKKSISYYEALKRTSEFQLSPEGTKIADNLISWIHSGMKASRIEKTSVVLYKFLEDSGYLSYLTQEEKNGNRKTIRQIYQLKQFFDFICNFEKITPGATVKKFVDYYSKITESGDEGKMYQPTDTPDSVNILTVHGAKGLEFKYVFVVNLVEERFPTRKRGEGIEIPEELAKEPLPEGDFHYEEERRLFYVAITRAKEKLFLTYASDYGGVRKKKLSRFLAELDLDKNFNDIKNKKIESLENLAVKQFDNISLPKIGQTNKIIDTGKFIFETPKVFSYSQINSYERCPYQYKLSHILKIPMKGSASFSFGNCIHNTLQKFYQRIQELNSVSQGSLLGLFETDNFFSKQNIKKDKKSISAPELEELLKIYEESWIPDWFKNKNQRENYYKKGKEILTVFYQAQKDNWTIPIFLEGFFKIKIGDYFINGRIDRIDKMPDGKLEIVDYKTGKGKNKLETDDKQQLLLYQIAVETLPQYRNYGEIGKLTFYYIGEDLKMSFIGKDKEVENLKEKLLSVMDNIQKGDFKATPNQFVCKYCDFKDICEFRIL